MTAPPTPPDALAREPDDQPAPNQGDEGAAPHRADLTPVVGANLKRLRVKSGLSLERLSRSSGVSRAMLSQIELGKNSASIETLYRIALGLRVRVADLFQSVQSPI